MVSELGWEKELLIPFAASVSLFHNEENTILNVE
jgi:hypothetical protein